MRKTSVIMAMPVIVEIADYNAKIEDINEVFSYLHYIDKKFSTYKTDSEISLINRGEIKEKNYSEVMKSVLALCDKTKKDTAGFFNISHNGLLDPSGIVKGYAINEGAKILQKKGYKNIYVEIAGDIQVYGADNNGGKWKIGIQNPFNLNEIIKVVNLSNRGIATSGTYRKDGHIYNPLGENLDKSLASVTVIGENVYEADRFATAIFAMGLNKAKDFILKIKHLECYIVTSEKEGIFTPGFSRYTN